MAARWAACGIICLMSSQQMIVAIAAAGPAEPTDSLSRGVEGLKQVLEASTVDTVIEHASDIFHASESSATNDMPKGSMQAMVMMQHAASGGDLDFNHTTKIGYLTLRGVNSTLKINRQLGSDQNEVIIGNNQEMLAQTQLPRFALLMVDNSDVEDSANKINPLKSTSIIGLNLLELVDTSVDGSLKYKVQIGDTTLSANDDGHMASTLQGNHKHIIEDGGALLIDLIGSSENGTSEQNQMSLQYQTETGAVSTGYARALAIEQEGKVLSQGIITGPLTFICCPFALLEAPIPLLWGFVAVKAVCCII